VHIYSEELTKQIEEKQRKLLNLPLDQPEQRTYQRPQPLQHQYPPPQPHYKEASNPIQFDTSGLSLNTTQHQTQQQYEPIYKKSYPDMPLQDNQFYAPAPKNDIDGMNFEDDEDAFQVPFGAYPSFGPQHDSNAPFYEQPNNFMEPAPPQYSGGYGHQTYQQPEQQQAEEDSDVDDSEDEKMFK
jgi:hypothetical protein